MRKRQSNKLPANLAALQNCIKRDPESYCDEFKQQYLHFQSLLSLFKCNPSNREESFSDIAMFLAQVAQCYPQELKTFPSELMDILRLYATSLDPEIRLSLCKALVLLRNKSLLSPTDLLELFFQLLICQDKELRSYLKNHLIQDIKGQNAKHRNTKMNTQLQNFMFKMLDDSNKIAAKTSLDIMITLYRKNIWNDAKTVNVIVTACFSKVTKIMVTAIDFFLGKDDAGSKGAGSDSDDDDNQNAPTVAEVMLANKVNKNSRKRKRLLMRTRKEVKRHKNKQKGETFNFSAIHLLHDPQGVSEKLYGLIQDRKNERFEVKLMIMDLISRLVGIHELFLFNFYSLLQRFLNPHQRNVTKLLQIAAQSSHELVPPDVLYPLLRTIADNFVTERNAGEVITVGLNSIRELCSRCPLVMTQDLLHDLAQYQTYRDKNAAVAAKSLVQLYRVLNPKLLQRKDRGRPTEASKAVMDAGPKEYGQLRGDFTMPGLEELDPDAEGDVLIEGDDDGNESDSSGWIDVNHDEGEDGIYLTSEEDEDDKRGKDSELDSDEDPEEQWETDDEGEDQSEDEDDEEVEMEEDDEGPRKRMRTETVESESQSDMKSTTSNQTASTSMTKPEDILTTRFLTQEEFKKLKAAEIKAKLNAARPKRFKDKSDRLHHDIVSQELLNAGQSGGELVSLANIERLTKKRKPTRAEKMAAIAEGRADREKWAHKSKQRDPKQSKPKGEKRKNKPYSMVAPKLERKKKASFQTKQARLRATLLKRAKQR